MLPLRILCSVSHIFDAKTLGWFASTRSFQDSCFQAYFPTVFELSLSCCTYKGIKVLSEQSGLFPSRLSTFARIDCLRLAIFLLLLGLTLLSQPQWNPTSISALHSRKPVTPKGVTSDALYSYTFHRQPAISRFDSLITPTLNSSQNFATVTSSALHGPNGPLQPGQK